MLHSCLISLAMLSTTTSLTGAGMKVSAPGAQIGGVPSALMSKLKTGVNITRWFCYLKDPKDTTHYSTYMVKGDYNALKALNVSFVRLCLAPDAIYDAGKLNKTTSPFVDSALEALTSRGMAVIYDLHDNGQLKLDDPAVDHKGFITFWEQAAARYKGKFESSVIFELVNEPVFQKNPGDWFKLQSEAVMAIRRIDPLRTIMVSGTSWSGIDGLDSLQTLPQNNLVYTYHCYDPFFFTHQGASWVGDKPGKFKKVPFPASPAAVAKILPDNDPAYAGDLKWYGDQKYDAAYLESRLSKATMWALGKRVPIVLGEFGAYPPNADPQDRSRWFIGMKAAIQKLGIANAIWGYDDGLGLGRAKETDGTVTLDSVAIRSFYNQTATKY